MIIILDNGHGKETPGKRSPLWKDGTQLFEWEYTRKLAVAIKDALVAEGLQGEIIVPESEDVGLSARAMRANEIIAKAGADNCLFVSIHCNAGGGKGWEVWSTERTNKSDILADCFVEAFNEVFPDRKNRGHKEKDFTVIYKTNCPSVLTENFFMDNEEECKFMLSDDCFKRLVKLHVNAIKKYFKI